MHVMQLSQLQSSPYSSLNFGSLHLYTHTHHIMVDHGEAARWCSTTQVWGQTREIIVGAGLWETTIHEITKHI
jgi:hypothetical protein